jgi:hypothetical protein
MDVRTSKLSSLNADQREDAQAEVYGDTLRAALTQPAFEGLTLWGFTDKHTWVKDFYYEDAPLPWDVQMKRKPKVFGALADALREAQSNKGPPRFDQHWGSAWQVAEPVDGSHGVAASAAPDWEVDA